jgi:hypothetical protein
LSSKEELIGDTGAEAIAEDLGATTLEPERRAVPVDPAIGFPPPPLETLVTPTLPGEGEWQAKDNDPFVHTLPGLPPTFVTTFIRSDLRRKATRVYVALWDPRVLQLNMMAGVAEPKSATGATGPGLIPREPAVLRRVAAAMNAGFQALHGEFGMMSDGVVYLPPKPYGATVALMRDGSTAFGTWPNDARIPEDIVSYRQNMTPMVVDLAFNPYKRTWWGGTPADWEDKTHTVRTGICLTKEHFVGYFYGADLAPDALAKAMMLTRCDYGLALDMNAGHSGLEFYKVAPAAELPALDRPLQYDWELEGDVSDLEGWRFRTRRLIRSMGLMNFPRYIRREGRDYFYLTMRYLLPGAPLTLGGKKARAGDGAWRVKGLPQHGFPYALATTEVAIGGGARARVLKIDPRMVASDAGGKGETVALINPAGEPAGEGTSLWLSPDAFALGKEPLVEGALRLASGGALAEATAALGVEDEAGMLVYAEVVSDGDKLRMVKAKALRELLKACGASQSLLLAEPWSIALGGDSALHGAGVRLPGHAAQVRLVRKRGPGAERIFRDTPVVAFDEWHPLQARRIRYFKKTEDK